MAEVEIRAVSKAFKKTQAVSDLSLTVGDGEFVALLGPTGAGKTTTLRLIAGLEMPDRGSIRIGGRDVTRDAPADRDVAFVFQQYSLYPHLTVFENMAFALRAPIRRVPEAEIRAKVREVARKQGMFTMQEDAIIKSMQKLVPFEEVNTLGGVYDTIENEEEPIETEEKRVIKGSETV